MREGKGRVKKRGERGAASGRGCYYVKGGKKGEKKEEMGLKRALEGERTLGEAEGRRRKGGEKGMERGEKRMEQ